MLSRSRPAGAGRAGTWAWSSSRRNSLTSEGSDILREFNRLLSTVTADGQRKRAKGKVFWKNDPDHLAAMHRHLHRYDRGELIDPDSGAHPLVHVAWRALAIAWQEDNDALPRP